MTFPSSIKRLAKAVSVLSLSLHFNLSLNLTTMNVNLLTNITTIANVSLCVSMTYNTQAVSRNIQLIVMPQGMSKRTLNTTQYRPKTDLILWRLHVVFVINNSYEPNTLLRPESQSSQNNNIGEQSSSASAISVTGAF